MKKLSFVATAVALLFASQAFAGFAFSNISENSPTGDPLTFGLPPTVTQVGPATVGDFDPLNFSANASGMGAADVTDGRLNFTLSSTGPTGIANVAFRETGGYALQGAGSLVTFAVTIVPEVTFVDGAATSIILPTMTASGEANTSGPGDWTLELELDVASALAGLVSDPLSVKSIDFAVDNRLVAIGQSATAVAFIDKKDFRVTAVPEPSSFLFLGLVATGALVRQKRRNAVAEFEA